MKGHLNKMYLLKKKKKKGLLKIPANYILHFENF